MGHNNDSHQPEQRGDSFTCRQPKESDFIMSATAPFTSSILCLNSRTCMPKDTTPERREFTSVTTRPPRCEEVRLNKSVVACNGTAMGEAAVKATTTPRESESPRETTPPTLAAATRGPTTATARPRKLAPLSRGLQLSDIAEGLTQRTAMSPLSAAGRLANVADVTARVQRMRARGRRAPEVVLVTTHGSAISSEHGSPRSLNLPTSLSLATLSLPRLPLASPKPKS